MKRSLLRTSRRRGNALMEYVVPMAVLLLAVGVLNTLFDINNLMADYFLAASGHVKADLQGTTLVTKPMGSGVTSAHDTGAGGFSVPYAAMTDGGGGAPAAVANPVPYAESTGIYRGGLMRSGRVDVAGATANERLYLFDDERGGSVRPEPAPPTL